MTKENKYVNTNFALLLMVVYVFCLLTRTLYDFGFHFILIGISLLSLIIVFIKKKGDLDFNRNSLSMPIFIICLLTIQCISLFYVENRESVITFMSYFFIGMSVYFFFITLITAKKNLILFSRIFIFVAFIISLITLYSHLQYLLFGIDSEFILSIRGQFMGRGLGFYGNPNYYSFSLLIAISFYLGLKHEKLINGKLFDIAFVLLSLDLFLTFSRGAILTYIILILILIIIKMFDNRSRFKKKIVQTIFVCIFFFIVILIFGFRNISLIINVIDQILFRFSDMFSGTGGQRYILWEEGYAYWSQNLMNLILGVGGNNFENLSSHKLSVHNGYLRYLYEMGLLGFLLLVIFLLILLNKSFDFKNLRLKSPYFFTLVVLVVFAFSNDTFHITEFWIASMCILTFKKNEFINLEVNRNESKN